MNRFAMILTAVILPAWVLPAPADGIFGIFGKKTKVNPAQRVPQLIVTLKTEQDERKRASAAAELGTYDGATFTEIVPVLVDALQNDPKSGVRMEAASSLGSIRPVTQLAGQALEKAHSSDENLRIRWHTKGILMRYRLAGYSSSKGGAIASKSTEPPVLESKTAQKPQFPPQAMQAPAPALFPTGPSPFSSTSTTKSQAVTPRNDDSLTFRPSIPRPLPQGPVFTTAVPQQAIREAPPPLPLETEGPVLTPFPPAPATSAPPPVPSPF